MVLHAFTPYANHIFKQIIRLACIVAQKGNNDPIIGDELQLINLENYRISHAERIVPAGTEAPGVGYMKFMLNDALTIGILDGANVEMYQKVGSDNFFFRSSWKWGWRTKIKGLRNAVCCC